MASDDAGVVKRHAYNFLTIIRLTNYHHYQYKQSFHTLKLPKSSLSWKFSLKSYIGNPLLQQEWWALQNLPNFVA